MQPRITYCTQCRGLRLGWNKRYIAHWLYCEEGLRTSTRIMARAVFAGILILSFPRPGASVLTADRRVQEMSIQQQPEVDVDAAVASMQAFLKRHQVSEANRTRLAESIVASARKYDLNPKLLASIMIVESRGNPFAISGKDAIGIMQIHLPTWGNTADRENINLFKIEDNIDFGARILRDYIRRFGVWGAVKRYNGFIPGEPAFEKSAQEYLSRVQRVYELQQPAIQRASELQQAPVPDAGLIQ